MEPRSVAGRVLSVAKSCNPYTSLFTAWGRSAIVLRTVVCIVVSVSWGCESRLVPGSTRSVCAVEARDIVWDREGGGEPLAARRLCARSVRGGWHLEGVQGALGARSFNAERARYDQSRLLLELSRFEVRGGGVVLRGERLNVDLQTQDLRGQRIRGTLRLDAARERGAGQ